MRTRLAGALTCILLLTPLLPVLAAAAAARPSDDSCPAGLVPEDMFTDVAADSPHEAPIDCLVWWRVALGVSRASYDPAGQVRRDQLATFVVNLVEAGGGVLPLPARDHFTDDEGSLHEHNVNRLADAGVLRGIGDGRFEPLRGVDRAQTATYLVQAYDELARQRREAALPAGPDAFRDDDGSVHEGSIDRAAAAGLAAGIGDGTGYAPLVGVRRDQMASFVTRTLDLLVENGTATTPARRAGDLDPSYASQGLLALEPTGGYDEARAATLDPDGRLVVAGESSVSGGDGGPERVFTLSRVLPDGAPDLSFGRDGTVVGDVGDPFEIRSIAVQPDGMVLAGGSASCGDGCTASVLARFDVEGRPDPAFGDAGRVSLTLDETGPIASLALDPQGRIVAGGVTRPTGSAGADDFSVVRYLPGGELDASFGQHGRVRTDFRGGRDAATSIALRPDGTIVAGGSSSGPGADASVDQAVAVARYLPDGTLDSYFGGFGDFSGGGGDGDGDGRLEADFLPERHAAEVLASLAVTADGGVVAVGHYASDGVTPIGVVLRWDPVGYPIGFFPWYYLEGGFTQATSVAVQPDGDLLVGGRVAGRRVPPGPDDRPGELGQGTDWDWALMRLDARGGEEEDLSFGQRGAVYAPVGTRASEVVLQPDGQIVMVGCSCRDRPYGPDGTPTASGLVVLRHQAESSPERAGRLDRRGFKDFGVVSTPVGDGFAEALDVTVDREDRILLAGRSSRSIGVARLQANGFPDREFSEDGVVTTAVGAESEARAVAGYYGGVMVGGRTTTGDASAFVLVRYDHYGALVDDFGVGGVVTTAAPGTPAVEDLGVLPEGRIVALGSAAVGVDVQNTGFLVVRYLPDGSLDPSFGEDGRVTVDFRGALDHAQALLVQEDGSLLVAGTSNDPSGAQESVVVLARLLEDGTLDASFGEGGRAFADLGPGYDALGGLAEQPDGALVVSADTDPYAAAPLAVARFTADGGLDESFGDDGVTTTDLPGPSRASDVTVDVDGRILVSATTGEEPDVGWVVAAYTPDGALDPSFGDSGVVHAAAGEHANAMALQGDGLVVAGCDCPEEQYARGGAESRSSFVVARFLLGR